MATSTNQAYAAYEANEAHTASEQPIIIHTTAHWYWQCHMCGHLNPLLNHVRNLWTLPSSVLEMQKPCANPSSHATPSGECEHDRCSWCFDLDENGTPIRFASGLAVSRQQYEAFWGWRFWAEREGLRSGEVTWRLYEEFCFFHFGGVPPPVPSGEGYVGERRT